MSFEELIVVIIISLIVMKPEDIKVALNILIKMKNYYTKFKQELKELVSTFTNANELSNLYGKKRNYTSKQQKVIKNKKTENLMLLNERKKKEKFLKKLKNKKKRRKI